MIHAMNQELLVDQELLIEKVTQELMRRLEAQEASRVSGTESSGPGKGKPWLAAGPGRLSCQWPELEYWDNFDKGLPRYSNYEGVVIPSLPSNQLVLASLGMQYGMESNLIVGALLVGVPVYASERGLDWLDALEPGSPLRQHYEECRRKLESFGVSFFSEEPAAATAGPGASLAVEEARMVKESAAAVDLSDKKLLTEMDVKAACKEGCSEVLVAVRALITPLALDHLRLIGARVTRVSGAGS